MNVKDSREPIQRSGGRKQKGKVMISKYKDPKK